MTETVIGRVIDILRRTRDGSDLAGHHKKLIEAVVNARPHDINEEMEVAVCELHAAVVKGRYAASQVWLHGIEHLTKDYLGYVYWRGVEVEHYSFREVEDERRAGLRLAERCRELESKGFPVNGRSAIDQRFLDAPPGTPWLQLLLKLYSAAFADGKVRWLVLFGPARSAVAITKAASGELEVRRYLEDDATDSSGCFTAFRALATEGFVQGVEIALSYDELISAVRAGGFTPADIELALA